MPKKYIPYAPAPLRGQAILNNIPRPQRLLTYHGNNGIYTVLDKGMPLYEAETLERVGGKSDNMLIRGECLTACAMLHEQGIKVDLVYIDPPFASGANYAKQIFLRQNPQLAEKVRKAGQTLDNSDLCAFEEKMYGDVWRKENYLNWMCENLCAIRSVMSDTASIYVHLDSSIGHYVKVLMDEVFGEDNFINEIIWSYRSGGASKKASIAKKHDTILFYKKSEDFQVNTLRERQYLERPFMGSCQDENGRYYVDTILTDSINGVVNQILPDGKLREYNTRPVLNLSSERLDYSTQKPEGLIELLLEIASGKDMLVADFFGGSGTTAAAAHKLGRRFIHCDPGINSIQITRDRLKKSGAGFGIVEIKDGVNLFRNPKQTMDKLTRLIPGLCRNANGKNAFGDFWFGWFNDSKLGDVPVYIPDLRDTSQKILDESFANKIVNEELFNLGDEVKKVVVYYVDIDNREAVDRQIGEDNATMIKVELRDLKDILADTVVDDKADIACTKTKDAYRITIRRFVSDRLREKISEFNAKNKLVKKTKTISIGNSGLELIEMISVDCTNKSGEWKSDAEIKIDKCGFITDAAQKTAWDGTITAAKTPLRLKIRNICGDEVVMTVDAKPAANNKKTKPRK